MGDRPEAGGRQRERGRGCAGRGMLDLGPGSFRRAVCDSDSRRSALRWLAADPGAAGAAVTEPPAVRPLLAAMRLAAELAPDYPLRGA